MQLGLLVQWDLPAQLVLLARPVQPEQWDLPDLPVLPERLDLPAQRDLPVQPEQLGLLELLPPDLPSQIFLPTVASTL